MDVIILKIVAAMLLLWLLAMGAVFILYAVGKVNEKKFRDLVYSLVLILGGFVLIGGAALLLCFILS